MRQRIILSLILLPFLGLAQSQISGTIRDAADGTPLPGANVIARPSGTGVTTDASGNFSLNIKAGDDSLSVSFIGYQTQNLAISGRSTFNLSLQEEVNILDELVVVGYGVQRKSDLTGAVSSVKEKDLVKIPSASPLQALQGKASGVQVTNSSGQPGSVPIVRVRGIGTTNDARPIYVVDGVILDDVQFLSSSDIASMEVLKDASATAIYGSRGANGVILITTKSGSGVGEGKPVINFGYEYSIQQLPKKIDLLNGRQFAEVVNAINPGTYNNLDLVPSTDWQDEVFKKAAPIHNANFSIASQTGKSQTYFGLGYFYQDGIVPKSDYERITVKLNQKINFSDNFRMGANINIAPSNSVNPANVIATIYRAQPTSVPFNPDGSYAEVLGSANPLAAIEYTNSTIKALRGVGNIYGEVDFLDKFTFRSSFGYDYGNGSSVSFTPIYFVSATQSNDRTTLNKSWYENNTWLWENTINYSEEFGKSRLDVLAGYTSQKYSGESFGGSVRDLIDDDPSLWYLSAGDQTTINLNNGASAWTMISYLARVNYTFDNRYLFTASLRRDGSSKFGTNYRYGNFPSFALGWNVANEDWFRSNLIERLKARASWGIIGNEKIGTTDQYSLVDNNQNAVFGTDEALNNGATYGVIGNPNLRWESTTQTDIGLEFGMFNNRLSVEVDYYNRVTEDILLSLIIPGHQGAGDFAVTRFNAASVLNRGFEWNLSWQENIGDFYYRLGATGNTVHNEVLYLNESSDDNSEDFISSGSLNNGQLVTRTQAGNSIGDFYGYNVIGIFQNQNEVDNSATFGTQVPGDLKFEDINGDGIIDDRDRVILGSYIPDIIYGFNVEGGYKGVSLNLDFYGVAGNQLYNGKNAVRPDLYNFEANVQDFWRGEGTSNEEPRPTAGGTNYEASSYFVQSGSYFRLRSATVGYELPGKWLANYKVSRASVYLRGTNIFTASKFTGYSPDFASESAVSSGIDLGVYPQTRIISAGLNLTF